MSAKTVAGTVSQARPHFSFMTERYKALTPLPNASPERGRTPTIQKWIVRANALADRLDPVSRIREQSDSAGRNRPRWLLLARRVWQSKLKQPRALRNAAADCRLSVVRSAGGKPLVQMDWNLKRRRPQLSQLKGCPYPFSPISTTTSRLGFPTAHLVTVCAGP